MKMHFLNDDMTFRIGKHKGVHLFKVERSYLSWVLADCKDKTSILEREIIKAVLDDRKRWFQAKQEKEANFAREAAGIDGSELKKVETDYPDLGYHPMDENFDYGADPKTEMEDGPADWD